MKKLILVFIVLFGSQAFATTTTQTIQSRVSQSSDDAEESTDGIINLHSSDLELAFDGGLQTVGIRFTDLAIPNNVTITKAYIQFKVDEHTEENMQLTIHAESTDNAPDITTEPYSISTRTKTNASVSWSPLAWSSNGLEGEAQRTSDLTSIVQEVVSRTGWQDGNAIAFIITGTDTTKRVAESYTGDQAGAPLLYIEYTIDSSAVAPVITLNGSNPMNINIGDNFIDPGATAQDITDGDLTSSMTIINDVNISKIGNHFITYSVTDSDGNSVSKVRTVFVNAIDADLNILNVPTHYPTISHAIASAVDGNIILIAPGLYEIHENIYIDKNNITVASRYLISGDENDIDNTIIKGDSTIRLFTGVNKKSANLKFVGLTITGPDKAIDFTDSYGEVHYCKIYNTTLRDAISFDGNAGGAVTHCRIENAGDDAIDVDTGQDGGSFLFAYNELINSDDDGIEIHLYTNSGSNMHFDIHDNLISGSGADGIQLIDYTENTNRTFDIYRNIFKDNGSVAIGSMFQETTENFQGTSMTERVRIYNNYFYNGTYHITGGDNMIILNNIFEGASGAAIHRAKVDSITDYNLFYNNAIDTNDTTIGNNNLYTNPQRNSDFTLQLTSLAIDAGTASYLHNSELVLDIPISKYRDVNPDMGRYEYGMSGEFPTLMILGDNPMALTVGDVFIDPGATAEDAEDGDLTSSIQNSSTVNMAEAGAYQVVYSVTDSNGSSVSETRVVNVNDPAPSIYNAPVITILGDNPMTLIERDTFVDPGATAVDNEDGSLTSSIQNSSTVNIAEAGTYQVAYSVTDSNGNSVTEIRTVNVISIAAIMVPIINFILDDTQGNPTTPIGDNPSIMLIGDNFMYLTVGDTFIDPGATAIDNEDGNLTSSIQSSSTVNMAEDGTYQVIYSVTDSNGNSVSVTRVVIINPFLETLYEDAEDATISKWRIYDNNPIGATIENVYDDEFGSRVIQFTGEGTKNGFATNVDIGTDNTVLEWKMKTDETFKMIVKVYTNEGDRYLYYTDYSNVNGEVTNDGEYIWYGLGSSSIDGTWHTYTRDLKFDFQRFEPSNDLISIGWIHFKGSGSFDDIKTYQYDSLPPSITILGDNPLSINMGETYIDPGATALDNVDGNLSVTIETNSTVNTAVAGTYSVIYSATDLNGNSASVIRSITVIDPLIGPILIYEDAEDTTTNKWVIYDNEPTGATIENIYDESLDSRVIQFDGNGTNNSYRHLYNGDSLWNDRTHKNLAWKMKYGESYEIKVKTTTLMGSRYLYYNNSNNNVLGSGVELYYGLGDFTSNNTWQTFERDISFDIKNAQSENELISIDKFTISGSGRIDDITTSGYRSYSSLNRIGYIKRSVEDMAILGDLESMRYIESDNELIITDDQGYLMYSLNIETHEVTGIIRDTEFAAFTIDNPNGYNPLNPTCVYDANTNEAIGFCDPEATAYDSENETLYLFTGNHPGELTTFKLTKNTLDQNFTVSDWKRIDREYTASMFIDGQLYVCVENSDTKEGEILRYNWETGATYGDPIFTIGHQIVDTAYKNGILWILTAPDMLYKIDFSTMSILDAYDMVAYDIIDPRGVEVIDDKLYIGDGYDLRRDDLKHAIHIFDLP